MSYSSSLKSIAQSHTRTIDFLTHQNYFGEAYRLIEALIEKLKEEKTNLVSVKTELERESELLSEITSRVQVKRQALNELELRLRDHHHKREAAAEELRELSVNAANFEAQKQHIADRIHEKYQSELSLEIDLSEFDLEQIEKRIHRSERFIENLGPINMAVQDEFEAEQSRLNFLKEQQADLVEAKSSLLETISKLDRIARKQFRETFGLIQEHFKGTFAMLFDGGEATMILEDPDDILDLRDRDIAVWLQRLALTAGHCPT